MILHPADVPESVITTLHGIRLTTPLRTVIDMAPELDRDELVAMIDDSLGRGLYTLEEAWHRLAQPDMATYRGAEILRDVLRPND